MSKKKDEEENGGAEGSVKVEEKKEASPAKKRKGDKFDEDFDVGDKLVDYSSDDEEEEPKNQKKRRPQKGKEAKASKKPKTSKKSKGDGNDEKISKVPKKKHPPRLGEIPEVEHKKISCASKTGRIVGAEILCDCCHILFTANTFEKHAGLLTHRNPYHSIIITESGRTLASYRNCMYCHTMETSSWEKGPFGPRTLCYSCGTKWETGQISEVFIRQLIDVTKGEECREQDPTKIPSPMGDSHAPTCQPLPTFPFKEFTLAMFEDLVLRQRQPVVLTGCDALLTPELWTFEYMIQKHAKKDIHVRYMELDENDESQFATIKDATKTLEWFLNNVETPNNPNDPDFDSLCVPTGKSTVMYAKDFSFSEEVPEWLEDLSPHLPAFLTPAGEHDLMGNLPTPTRPIVWMGYIGANGTRTPLHLDKLASIAFNLLTIGEGTKKWWLIDHRHTSKLEEAVAKQGGSLWKDNFWMAPEELEGTQIPMWFHEQKKGDLVIVPPLVAHTVLNSGKLSCAVAANMLHEEALWEGWTREQVNRTIHRLSIYRFKMTVYHSILREIEKDNPNISRLEKLSPIFGEILQEEETEDVAEETKEQWFACDGCGADIFNRRYHCGQCRLGDYDLCVPCFRTFGSDHFHKMQLLEKTPFEDLLQVKREVEEIISRKEKRDCTK